MTPGAALLVTAIVLGVFAWVGLRGVRGGALDADEYLTARRSQSARMLALSFLASGLGAWILFTPAETGVLAGWGGVIGYGIGAALPFVAFVWLGPRIRRMVPDGVTLGDFVRTRYGPAMRWTVATISVFYMFIFVTAELTAIGGVAVLLVDPGSSGMWVRLAPVAGVAAVTVAYTAVGGLPASLRTDRLQAWIVLALGAIALGAVWTGIDRPVTAIRTGAAMADPSAGWESLLVLPIAVTAANLFHQGYWQRTWSARDPHALRAGALGGALLTLPVLLAFGVAGLLASGLDRAEVPAVAFFALIADLPTWVLAIILGLAVALVASSIDTLQNALAAVVATELTGGRVTLSGARWVTVVLAAPAVALALLDISVLRLFLVADLLAAAAVFPVFLGLWRGADGRAAAGGIGMGLAAVVLLGWVRDGSVAEGLRLLTLPGTFDLAAFVAAPLAAAVFTVVGSWALRVADGDA